MIRTLAHLRHHSIPNIIVAIAIGTATTPRDQSTQLCLALVGSERLDPSWKVLVYLVVASDSPWRDNCLSDHTRRWVELGLHGLSNATHHFIAVVKFEIAYKVDLAFHVFRFDLVARQERLLLMGQ